jgi:hypothetical protein
VSDTSPQRLQTLTYIAECEQKLEQMPSSRRRSLERQAKQQRVMRQRELDLEDHLRRVPILLPKCPVAWWFSWPCCSAPPVWVLWPVIRQHLRHVQHLPMVACNCATSVDGFSSVLRRMRTFMQVVSQLAADFVGYRLCL